MFIPFYSPSECIETADESQDPDYIQPETDTNTPTESQDCDPNTQTVSSKQKRKKTAAPDTWKKNITKRQRLEGKQHISRRGVAREEKAMKPTCSSKFCLKSKFRHCQSVSEEERENIFLQLWSMESWSERKNFVKALTERKDKKQVKNLNGTRGNPLIFNLRLSDGKAVQVCKYMFCATMGLSERTVGEWLSPEGIRMVEQEDGNEHLDQSKPSKPQKRKFNKEDETFLKEWLLAIPCVDSHYCRKSEAYKNKRFLEPGTKIIQLFERYKIDAEEKNRTPTCLTTFRQVFQNLGFSIFRPRKDQCDECISFKYGNISRDEYEKHIAAKNKARKEKENDKELSINDKSVSVWTMDVQAVLCCPQTKASALYYRTKLQVHNFTLYNLATKEGYCYPWEETEGELKMENFSSMQYQHFKKILINDPGIKTLIVWSDGAVYQNKNSSVSNAYLQLAMEHGIEIYQKYLVVGHTQMECDAMHSTIERNIVCDIHVPRDFYLLMSTARRNPGPYHVQPLTFKDFKRMDKTRFSSIRPGRKVGDPVVNQLSALLYSSACRVMFKLFHEEVDWQPLPIRINPLPQDSIVWEPMYRERLPIVKRKFDDLMYMKKVLPEDVHSFYNLLPHL